MVEVLKCEAGRVELHHQYQYSHERGAGRGDDTADLFKFQILHFYIFTQWIFREFFKRELRRTKSPLGGEERELRSKTSTQTHRLVLKGEFPAFSVVFDFNLSWAT